MARTVKDVALFLDTMAGFCPLDPMTFDAPTIILRICAESRTPRRIAYASTIGGAPVDRRQGRLQPNLWSILNPWA